MREPGISFHRGMYSVPFHPGSHSASGSDADDTGRSHSGGAHVAEGIPF